MKLKFPLQILEKYPDMKIQESPVSWSPTVPCGQTDRGDETIDFRNFANASKNQ
jgi:hypothetical protein